MEAAVNVELVRRLFEAWNQRDLEAYAARHDPGCLVHGLAPEPVDVAGLLAFYDTIWAAFPDAEVVLEDVVADLDRGAYRYTLRGTHQGELLGVAATGRPVEMAGQTFCRFGGGKVAERWQSADTFGLLQQIGGIPAPS